MVDWVGCEGELEEERDGEEREILVKTWFGLVLIERDG